MTEEYEMVPQPSRLSDEFRVEEEETDTASRVSEVFDDIYEHQKGTNDDFYNSPIFHSTLQRYKNGGALIKRMCTIISIVSVGLWILGVIVYSHGLAVKAVTNWTSLGGAVVQVSGTNILLESYSPEFGNITMESVRKGVFTPFKEEVTWLNQNQYPRKKAEGGGGYYLGRNKMGGYEVKHLDDTTYSHTLFETPQFLYKNNFFYITGVQLNPNISVDDPGAHHIVITDKVDQFRQLSFALYWLYNEGGQEYIPIEPKKQEQSSMMEAETIEKLHFAEFSPDGKYILFGFKHDLYLQEINGPVHRITDNGSPDIFNGKSDWVYEEEITEDDKLFWWSPDSKHLVFAKLNDTKVQDYELEFYVKDSAEIGIQYTELEKEKVDELYQYPIKTKIKYPKTGTPNPVITLHEFHLADKKVQQIDSGIDSDLLLYSATWVGDSFIFKYTDRYSRVLTKSVYHDGKVTKIDTIDSSKYNGWIEKIEPLTVISDEEYVDRVVHNDQVHLALFKVDSKDYRLLTDSKDWGIVAKTPVAFNKHERMVYALTLMRSSMDCHLVAVELEQGTGSRDENIHIKQITGIDQDGRYLPLFSADGQYMDLLFTGPGQPWQRLVNLGNIHDELKSEALSADMMHIIEKSPIINHYDVTEMNVKKTNFPTKVYRQITVGKYENGDPIMVNMVEILPPNFNPSDGRKHGLLVHAYGGPGLQTVEKAYEVGFQEAVSATLDAVVLVIDPRGTGGQGWRFKSFAKDQIGRWEPRDVQDITSKYISANEKFIDSDKVAIWGWSYGGFTTLKTLEYDQGNTFKFGMAVAPVTNWLFYDSVYTERYMGKERERIWKRKNAKNDGEDLRKGSIKDGEQSSKVVLEDTSNENYQKYAQVKDFKALGKPKRFLLMHGTSDDNVHLQNSLWLLDKLNVNNVKNYDVQFFPDSDHSIRYHHANSIVYDKLLRWLKDAFSGKFEDF